MYSWGQSCRGQLGHDVSEDSDVNVPKLVENLPAGFLLADVRTGEGHVCILSKDGKIFTCGANDFGQLGHDFSTQKKFVQVTALSSTKVKAIDCGRNHTVALDADGKAYSWGRCERGQLGFLDATANLPHPRLIGSLSAYQVIQIATGDSHNLALTKCGRLFSWGDNSLGQLGIGVHVGSLAPVPQLVECLESLPVRNISCGGNHCVVVSKSGAVYAWGDNQNGQCGLGDSESIRHLPGQIRSLRSQLVSYAVCGAQHTACLTEDGGVFTFGAGTHGQLGHGVNHDELIPRKVIDLMGSEVTRVVCGSRHTLALVAGRLYAFGLGGFGQLGTGNYAKSLSPTVVPFNSPVTFIGAGYDHSFALTSQTDASPIAENIAEVSAELVDGLTRGDDSSAGQLAFGSSACLNGSFLAAGHKPCTSNNDGLDVDAWVAGLTGLASSPAVDRLATESLVRSVLPRLVSVPPDVETLRQFIFLPVFPVFGRPAEYMRVHCPYARGFISLPKPAWSVVEKWLARQSKEYLAKVVANFKAVVVHVLETRKDCDCELELMLIVLRIINRINVDNGCIISYEDFYIPQVSDLIELPDSYIRFKTTGSGFNICNFPFVFDANAKTTLLRVDQNIQMHHAAHQSVTEAIMVSMLTQQACHDQDVGMLVCSVRRDHLVADTLTFIQTIDRHGDLKKPLRVKFDGEEGEDAGGVRNEFFLLLLKEILDPKYGMFREYDQAMWFHPACLEDEAMFGMIGVLCGLAIYNFTIINLPFPLPLYKKLLGDPVGSIEDVESLSPSLAKGFNQLLEYDGDDLADVFGLNFTMVEEGFGESRVVELKAGGADLAVDKSNRHEYVALYADRLLNGSTKSSYDAFHAGFHHVCGGRVLDLFHARELMALVVGTENYDWDEFEAHADYKNGYDKDHPTIRFFWEVFHGLAEEDKRDFLLFLTGSYRIPMLGMSAKKLTIQRVAGDTRLPVAHTCFNVLDLPEYATKEKLKYKLLQAIRNTKGFGLA